MSDDEYFDNDDIFTAAELDAIPLLNQPPSLLPAPGPSVTPVVAPSQPLALHPSGTSGSNPVSFSEGSPSTSSNILRRSNSTPNAQPQNVASTSSHVRQPAQASGSRTSGTRLSAIMNALRSTQAGPSTSQRSDIFGPPIGLLPFHTPKSSSNPETRKRASPSSSEDSPTRKSPRKRNRQSPSAGAKRRRSSDSPSKAVLEAVAREGRLEGLEMLEDELTCAICCDIYVAPQVTPCGHTACGPCMKSWLSANKNCPICRAHLSTRDKLATNFLGASMLDRLFAEALKHKLPDWSPGGAKQLEWDKRKQAWDRELAAAAANGRSNRAPPAPPPVAAPQRPQRAPQPLFRPAGDSEDDDGDDEDDDDFDPHIYYLFN